MADETKSCIKKDVDNRQILTKVGGGSPGQNLTLRKKTSLVCLPRSKRTAHGRSVRNMFRGKRIRNIHTVSLDDCVASGGENEKLRQHFDYYKGCRLLQ